MFRKLNNIYTSVIVGERPLFELPKSTPSSIWDEEEVSDYQDYRTDIYKDIDLYMASEKGRGEVFGTIINRVSRNENESFDKILSERVSTCGNTLLHTAVIYGNSAVVTYIMSRAIGTPAWILKKNMHGNTALHLAAKAGNSSIVSALLQIQEASSSEGYRDNRMREVNKKGDTPLHEALNNGHEPIATILIQADHEVLYCQNHQRESPLYLAVKIGSANLVQLILQKATDQERMFQQFKHKSPIHMAVKKKNKDILEAMLNRNPDFASFKDAKGRTPLHYGAYFGYYEEVDYLVVKYAPVATQIDKLGLFPIHLAASGGHVDIINTLLLDFLKPMELLDTSGLNILHHAARRGRYNVVTYILNKPNLAVLLNMQDLRGNAPLHYATFGWHPRVVSALTWDPRVDVKLKNHEGKTALDIVGWHPRVVSALTWDPRVDVKLKNHEGKTALDIAEEHIDRRPPFCQRLTWCALKAAGVPRSRPPQRNTSANSSNVEYFTTRANTLLVVATLVATLAFAAGFTVPGGYSSSDMNLGMAVLLRKPAFHVFVMSDSIALYFSLVVVKSLLFAILGDLDLMYNAVSSAQPLLGTSVIMVSVAYTSGLYVVLSSLGWLSILVLVLGSIFTSMLFILAVPLSISFDSTNLISRYISYYPYCLMMLASGSYKEDELDVDAEYVIE